MGISDKRFELNVDLLSMSSHKLYGPKGAGALYVRKGVKLTSFIHGGAQERGRRASTENVPGIIGMAKALELADRNMEEHNRKLTALRDRTIEEISEKIPFVRLNGHREKRLPEMSILIRIHRGRIAAADAGSGRV